MISETTRISDALVRMQREHVHISLIIDEYGGTAGILTMEDILEEIVGEIRDEFDDDEVNDIVKLDDHTYQINGRVLLDDLNEKFGIEFEDSEDIDTIGGWLQSQILICKKMTSLILNMIVGRLQKSTIIKLFGST